MAAQLWTLRQMSFSVAGMLQAGETPNLEAALVKDLGNAFERDVPERVRQVAPRRRRHGGDRFEAALGRGGVAFAVLDVARRHPRNPARHHRPRPRVCAKGPGAMRDTILYDSAMRLFGDHVTPQLLAAAEDGTWPAALWHEVTEAGYLDVLADGPAGMVEAVTILRAAGHHAAPIPLPKRCWRAGCAPPRD